MWEWSGWGSAISIEIVGGFFEVFIIVGAIEFLRRRREARIRASIGHIFKMETRRSISDALAEAAKVRYLAPNKPLSMLQLYYMPTPGPKPLKLRPIENMRCSCN